MLKDALQEKDVNRLCEVANNALSYGGSSLMGVELYCEMFSRYLKDYASVFGDRRDEALFGGCEVRGSKCVYRERTSKEPDFAPRFNQNTLY